MQYKYMKINKTNVVSLGNIFLFSLLVAFRGDTRDTASYLYIFKYIETFSFNPVNFYWQTGIKVGFGAITYIIPFFIKSFSIFSFIVSALTFLFIIIVD